MNKWIWTGAAAAVVIGLLLIGPVCPAGAEERKISGRELKSLLAGKTVLKNPNVLGRIRALTLLKNGELILTDYEGKKHTRKWFMERSAWCITKLKNNKECYFLYDMGDGTYDIRRARDDTSIGLATISE